VIVDGNAYVGDWPYWRLPAVGEDDLLRTMDAHGIDVALITSTKALLVDALSGNAEVSAMARRHPDRLRPVAVIRAGAAAEAAQSRDTEPTACRLTPALDGTGGLSRVDDVLAHVVDMGVPLFLTARVVMNWGLPRYPVADLAPVVDRVGDLPVVLSGVNRVDFAAAADLAGRPNVYLETSCLQEFDAMPRAVQAFTSDRLLMGTGLLLQQASCGLVKVTDCDSLDPTDRERIAGGTAQRLFRIEDRNG
jgi:predicted TIM-barrel fold metal-dependent hydrolase